MFAVLLTDYSSVFNSFHIRLKYVLNSGALRRFSGVSESKAKISGMVCLMAAGLPESMITLSANEMASDRSWVTSRADLPSLRMICPISSPTVRRV